MFERWAAELQRHPLLTDQEKMLTDLDVGVRRERGWIVRHLYAMEF